jgi:dethiobiotin synthetase
LTLPPALFVTGTDTGVGKTTVASALVRAWRQLGERVAVLKPAESGCAVLERPADAAALCAAAGLATDQLRFVCPFRYVAPVAPAVAARREGPPFTLAPVLESRNQLVASLNATLLLAEGAGGLLVPYAEDLDGAGLAAALGAQLLIVARAGLGTLNHTSLTVEAARARNLPINGIILCRTSGAADPSEVDNAAEIARLTGLMPLYTVPHLASSPTFTLPLDVAARIRDRLTMPAAPRSPADR